jgi:hypothetical protein
MTLQDKKIRPHERDVIIPALAAGLIPRIGLPHIQVGRAREIEALVRDIDRVSKGGASVRFIIGEYGSGKTFFLNLVRLIALELRCVTVNADLTPVRRLHARGGEARSLYAAAVHNLATRQKPDGNALSNVVERFVTQAVKDGEAAGRPVEQVIDQKLAPIQDHIGGYDFAAVLKAYWRASENGDDALKISALRWLRGEFSSKLEARQALGVRTIIGDENVYDSLKLLAAFTRITGYAGMFVMLDEMANIYHLQNSQARNQNFEQILHIINDTLQGNAAGIGFVMCGTPEFLSDTRRGMYSYGALQSRLGENPFATGGLVDFSGPVIRLESLGPEELLVLLYNLRAVFAGGDPSRHLVPDEALKAFLNHCNCRIGKAYFRKPRETVKAFVNFLAVLEHNPEADWKALLGNVEVATDRGGSEETASGSDEGEGQAGNDDELTSLRLGA